MSAVEPTVLTQDQREAIRECRFKTPNMAHTFAWAWTYDLARAQATGMSFTAFTRSRNPEVREYELTSSDPAYVEFIAGLMP